MMLKLPSLRLTYESLIFLAASVCDTVHCSVEVYDKKIKVYLMFLEVKLHYDPVFPSVGMS